MRSTAGATTLYSPEQVDDALIYRELLKIQAALLALADGHLDVTTVAPAKPRPGDFRYAAAGVFGVSEGFYGYHTGAWRSLG